MTVAGMNIADFTPSVVNYTTDVAADVATVTVTATPVYEGAEAVVAPADADPNTGDHQVNLETGANVITITVTGAQQHGHPYLHGDGEPGRVTGKAEGPAHDSGLKSARTDGLTARQLPTTTSSSRPFRTAQITSSCFVPIPSLSCMR